MFIHLDNPHILQIVFVKIRYQLLNIMIVVSKTHN